MKSIERERLITSLAGSSRRMETRLNFYVRSDIFHKSTYPTLSDAEYSS